MATEIVSPAADQLEDDLAAILGPGDAAVPAREPPARRGLAKALAAGAALAFVGAAAVIAMRGAPPPRAPNAAVAPAARLPAPAAAPRAPSVAAASAPSPVPVAADVAPRTRPATVIAALAPHRFARVPWRARQAGGRHGSAPPPVALAAAARDAAPPVIEAPRLMPARDAPDAARTARNDLAERAPAGGELAMAASAAAPDRVAPASRPAAPADATTAPPAVAAKRKLESIDAIRLLRRQ